MKKFKGLSFVLLLVILSVNNCLAQTITFSCLPNTETNLAGYKIHWGSSSYTYTKTVTFSSPAIVNGRVIMTLDVGELTVGETYYFAATAFDTEGMESGYSNEVPLGGNMIIDITEMRAL